MSQHVLAVADNIVRWFGTDFGTSTFFFLLDFLVVVLLLPEVLLWRSRKRWRTAARTLLYDALTTIEIVSTESNAIHFLLYPMLKNFPKEEPDAPPAPDMLAEISAGCRGTRRTIEAYKSSFGLTNISLQSFPKQIEILTAFVHCLVEIESQLRILETASDWEVIWPAWLILKSEVHTTFPGYRKAIQRDLSSAVFR